MNRLFGVSCQGNALEPYKRGWSRGTRGFRGFTILDTGSTPSIQPTSAIERNHTKKPIKSKLKFLIFPAADAHRNAIKLHIHKLNHLFFPDKKRPDTASAPGWGAVPSQVQFAAPGFCRKPDSGFLTVSEKR
jgi:hypothetical protein